MNKSVANIAEKLQMLLDTLEDGPKVSVVIGIAVVTEDDPESEHIKLEHITAYKGEFCAEALFGLMADEELIDKGVVDMTLDHMKTALEDDNERSWEETTQDGADSDEGHPEGYARGAIQDP